jgi:hypothetical protein
MNLLSDDILNKYIDGELDLSSLQHVNEVLSSSIEDKKRVNALLAVHNELKKIKEEEVDSSFTELLMKRLQYRKKAFKEQRNFVFMISSIFITTILIVVGLVVYSAFTQPSDSQVSTDYSNYLISFFKTVTSSITQIFTSRGISIFGSILSLGILISGYFFFENLKASKQNFSK